MGRRRDNQTADRDVSRHGPSRRSPHDQVRGEAGWVIERTLASRAPVTAFLDSAIARSDPRDHSLLRELVLGTLRWLRRVDHVIDKVSSRGMSGIDGKLRTPLRLAVYQLLFLDRMPVHAIVNEAVEEAWAVSHRGGASFVNALLRRVAKRRRLDDWPVEINDPVRRLGIELSHPDFLVQRWLRRLGEQRTRELLQWNNTPKPMHLLAFRDRGGRELLAEELIDAGCQVQASSISPLGLKVAAGHPLQTPAFQEGRFYIQDEVSQIAALLGGPHPAEHVLDLASAPGGKTFAMLAARPQQPILALDVDPHRALQMRQNCRRLQLTVKQVVADGRRSPFRRGFDRVVLDAPCSGTGTLRKHPELKWRLSEDEISRLADQSFRLLRSAAESVAAGGVLVCITCSVEEEENEGIAKRFLEGASDFQRASLEDRLQPPLSAWIEGRGLWRIWPEDDHDGFTVQLFERSR